ncbi:hypothetical protein THRCLA_05024 [Thraustotheca clavata]|uniref:FYVE-type domain-containing protein n=1 Tax=Thraustotheca clavata TaxID=74557 RepID=A0A1V9ZX74_9STRA|nr:hypothetical protein THRCLA_05024 [Thraustotheca clavata]
MMISRMMTIMMFPGQSRGMAKMSERAMRRKALRDSKKKAERIPPLKETLRKLYMRTHPDLFGQYPKEQETNTESYKELMGILDAIENTSGEFPPAKKLNLPFYLTTSKPGQFQQVTLNLKTTGGSCVTLMETQLGAFFEQCGWPRVFEWNKGSWGLTTDYKVNSNEQYDTDEPVKKPEAEPVAPAYQEAPKSSPQPDTSIEAVLTELNDIFEIIAAVPYMAHAEEYAEIYDLYTKEDGQDGHVNGITELERRGGYQLTQSVHQIWEGERDFAKLSAGVDTDSAMIIQRILMHSITTDAKMNELIAQHEAEEAKAKKEEVEAGKKEDRINNLIYCHTLQEGDMEKHDETLQMTIEDYNAGSDDEEETKKPSSILRSSSSPYLGPRSPLAASTPPPLPVAPMKSSINNIAASLLAIARPSTALPSPTTASERKTSADILGLLGNAGTSVFFSPPLLPPAFANLTICENCKDEVGTLLGKNRHHCRNCGGTFCQTCSSKNSVIPYEALVHKGEFRVCDCCFVRIREYQAQTKSPQATWNGLQPMSETSFLEMFNLPEVQSPVVIFSCCYFPEINPFYGHLFLTRDYVAFSAYRSLDKPILISYDDITSVVKPEFYFINALQLKTKDKTWFFAEFNGLRSSNSLVASPRVGDDEDFVPLPPDETLISMTKVMDCEMPGNVRDVFEYLFSDKNGSEFYTNVMVSTKDIDISVGEWQLLTSDVPKEVTSGFRVSTETFTHYRRVESKHPPKVSFPGLPPYAECVRHQLYRHNGEGKNWTRLVIADCLRMNKIPFSDYFEIETRWVFTRDGKNYCHAEVGLVIHFLKSTWFKSQIVSSTISESREAYETWSQHGMNELRRHHSNPTSPQASSSPALELPEDLTSITRQEVSLPTTDTPTRETKALIPQFVSQISAVPVHWILLGCIGLYMLLTLRSILQTMRLIESHIGRLEDIILKRDCPADMVNSIMEAMHSINSS